jgi:3D (Asp-Asp-Asp) domain-containing protein
MNKHLSVSEISEPPLLMLFLAAFSLVFNLCFPQYTASAHAEGQKFAHDKSLSQNVIALNEAKVALATKQEMPEAAQKEENSAPINTPVAITSVGNPAPKAKKTASAKPKSVSRAVQTDAVAQTAASSKWVTVTAYSSTVDQCDADPFTTAKGTHVRDGIIAINGVDFGTKVKFPSLFGDKVFVVEDRMNSRYNSNHADIWFASTEQARQFGIRKLEMVIVS